MEAFGPYLRRLKKLLQLRGRSREDAEDLIQEAFLRMQEYCVKGRVVERPEGFLARTVARLAINARRDAHDELYVDTSIEELNSLIDTRPSPDEVFEADECLNRMRAALDAVNPRVREAFFMHRLDGMSYGEIARALRLSISSIEKYIATAMATLDAENEGEWK